MTNTVRRHSAPGAKRCAFTGYRPQKMPFGFNESDPRCIDFKRRVKETIQALYDMGYRHFISGGALGMDMFAAEAVLELRAQHPDMILEMVSPFDDLAQFLGCVVLSNIIASAHGHSPLIQGRFDLHDRHVESPGQLTGHGCAAGLAVVGGEQQVCVVYQIVVAF